MTSRVGLPIYKCKGKIDKMSLNMNDILKILLPVIVGFLLGTVGGEYVRQRLFTPTIVVSYKPEMPFTILTRAGINNKTYPLYQFRISIFNKSDNYKADNHVVMLTGLWHLAGSVYEKEPLFRTDRLRPLGYGPTTILPKMTVYYPLCRIASVEYQKDVEKDIFSGNPDNPQLRFRSSRYAPLASVSCGARKTCF